jgi:hypothetical protein
MGMQHDRRRFADLERVMVDGRTQRSLYVRRCIVELVQQLVGFAARVMALAARSVAGRPTVRRS